MTKTLFAALVFTCLVRTATAADLSPPERFEIYYGNGLFGFVTLRLQDGDKLVFERHDPHHSGQELIEPSPEAWARFRKGLDQLRVWKWKKNYPNPGVTDGTQWRVLLVYRDRTLDVSGSNAYPLLGGASNNSPRVSRHFQAFLNNLRDLVGREIR